MKSLCILGRQPKLGLAELEALYGAEHIQSLKGAALLDIEASEINFKRLGGSLKVAKILNILPTTNWAEIFKYLTENIPKHLDYLPAGTFTLGVSLYGFWLPLQSLNRDLLKIKKIIRDSGRSVRIVPNKTLQLNSAQVLHNKLTSRGAWELLLVRDGARTILAQTMFVQDIEAYAKRDQVRPKRDARVGMLPPKLAQIIINLAKPKAGSRVLDPFCGTGVILQEALLMGYPVLGSDNNPRMVEYARQNLEWLRSNQTKELAPSEVKLADATNHQWPKLETVASEVYLGRPLASLPDEVKLNQIIRDVNTITSKFLINIGSQIGKDTCLSLAIPAWHAPRGFKHLPLIDHLSDLGYNRLSFVHVANEELIYFRPQQIVARELLILESRRTDE